MEGLYVDIRSLLDETTQERYHERIGGEYMGKSGVINQDFKGEDNTAYHDVIRLFKIYRSVNWRMVCTGKETENMFMMPIDTGNKAIKTENFEFNSGITMLADVPGENEEALMYQGRYYRLSHERNVYLPDKTMDDRYYLLTLFAIAKELEEMSHSKSFIPGELISMDLVVGLPPLYYRGQYKKFREYFYRDGKIVHFVYMGKSYRVTFSNVFVHMQTYAAYLYMAKELKLSTYPKVLMIDIGGFTMDYMLLEKGMILWNYTDSTGKGVISMYQRVNKGIREKFDLDLKENDIDSILKGENCMYGEPIRKRVEEIVTEHVEEMLGMFRECGIDLRSSMTIFVGGGSILLSKIIEDVWKHYDGEYYVVNDSKVNVRGYRKKYLFDIGMQ